MKRVLTWHSDRLGREVTLVRWGVAGTPVIVFPTAGGDAEEIERFHLVGAASDLLAEGRVKIYSCDNVAGRALLEGAGTPTTRGWIQSQYLEYVLNEVVPAIYADCGSSDLPIFTAGASIGAWTALACVTRYPWVFSRALCMSGTYDLTRFIKDGDPGPAFYGSSPIHFLPQASEEHLATLRQRFVLLVSGEGRAEDIGESWNVAHLLGSLGIPNRVDSWGADWDHDWVTWRAMLPKYLSQWTAEDDSAT